MVQNENDRIIEIDGRNHLVCTAGLESYLEAKSGLAVQRILSGDSIISPFSNQISIKLQFSIPDMAVLTIKYSVPRFSSS